MRDARQTVNISHLPLVNMDNYLLNESMMEFRTAIQKSEEEQQETDMYSSCSGRCSKLA